MHVGIFKNAFSYKTRQSILTISIGTQYTDLIKNVGCLTQIQIFIRNFKENIIFSAFILLCAKCNDTTKSARSGNYPCWSSTELDVPHMRMLLTVQAKLQTKLQCTFRIWCNSISFKKMQYKFVENIMILLLRIYKWTNCCDAININFLTL